ncbi:MAG: hypothetical protein DLM50_00825 [Candidatus Meridianibacter frigidus]|nr:MAG: hypothetical protein DLM50_00825 [Candidatus Eremiobacteraeota bacterium]
MITTLILVACGRQVTPDRAGGGIGGLLPGHMLIKYRIAPGAGMDFAHIRYLIVLNTSGNGGSPFANGFNTGFANYSFIFAVGGNQAGFTQVQLFQLIPQPNGQGVPSQRLVPFSPQQVQLQPNSNGQNTEFTLNFDRTLMFGIPTGTPPPAGNTPSPTTSPQSIWNVNFLTTDVNSNPLDALGIGGVNDTSFSLQLPVNDVFDFISQLTVPTGATQASTPAAQLQGGEIVNNP